MTHDDAHRPEAIQASSVPGREAERFLERPLPSTDETAVAPGELSDPVAGLGDVFSDDPWAVLQAMVCGGRRGVT